MEKKKLQNYNAVLISILIALIPISIGFYAMGVNHGENNKNVEYLEKDKLQDKLKSEFKLSKDSIRLLKSHITILEKDGEKSSDSKKDYTNFIVHNQTNKHLFVTCTNTTGMGGGFGAPLAPNFYYQTKITVPSLYKLVYQSYDRAKKIKGDTLKISEIRVPVPFLDKHITFCSCDLIK